MDLTPNKALGSFAIGGTCLWLALARAVCRAGPRAGHSVPGWETLTLHLLKEAGGSVFSVTLGADSALSGSLVVMTISMLKNDSLPRLFPSGDSWFVTLSLLEGTFEARQYILLFRWLVI